MQYFQEVKSKIMNGDSSWRYKWLMNCRPEILQAVPLKSHSFLLGNVGSTYIPDKERHLFGRLGLWSLTDIINR